MNTLNLEQVKEHFKYAKEVRCLADGTIYDISTPNKTGITKDSNKFVGYDSNRQRAVILANTNQLAEILTYIFDRGEEVEVSNDSITWFKNLFIGFTKSNEIVSEYENDNGIGCYKFVRKLTPESLLEPQLSELKKKAKEMNCTVTVIFENK